MSDELSRFAHRILTSSLNIQEGITEFRLQLECGHTIIQFVRPDTSRPALCTHCLHAFLKGHRRLAAHAPHP